MKVLELLDEIVEIVDTSSGVPLTGKILVDAEEILEIVKEIRVELPDEIQQAQWIKEERQKILEEARKEYEKIVADAKDQAAAMIDTNEITVQSKVRADEITRIAEANVKGLKMSTYDYIDNILFGFQEKMSELNSVYLNQMFTNIQKTFEDINMTIDENRSEIKNMIYNENGEIDAADAEYSEVEIIEEETEE